MALTATFAADFDRFEASLKSAQFQLQAFDRATSTSMKSLKRETEGFSGQKVAIEAARMAEAIGRLGGSGGTAAGLLKLLPDELKRVSAALDTAAQKAKLLGETLPPSLQKIRDEIARMPQATTPAAAGIGSMVTAFKGFLALGITAKILQIGTSIVNAVDQFDELAERITDTTDNIQRLQAVSQSYDVSLDALTNGVQELQKRLGDPSDEFVASLGRLNLTVADLKKLAPTDAILELLGALGQIPNASDRAAIANDALGRSYKELSAAMKDGVEQTDAWIKMAPETIRFVDSFKEGASRLGSAMLALTANVAANVSGWKPWTDAVEGGRLAINALFLDAQNFQRFIDQQKGKAPTAPGTPGSLLPSASLTPALDPADEKAMAAMEKSLTKSAEAAIDLNREMAAAAKAAQKASDEATIWGGGIHELATWMEDLADASRALELPRAESITKIFEMGPDIWLDEFQTWLDMRGRALQTFHEDHAKDLAKIFDFGPDAGIASFQGQLDKAAKSIKGTFVAAFADLPNVILRALEGGGDVFRSIGALIGSKIFGADSDLVKSVSGWLAKTMGGFGKVLGSMIPGLGTLLGSGLGKLIDKLFGPGEHAKVNDMRDAFTAAAGGIDALAEHAAAAGLTLRNFYAADTVKEYEAAIRELEDAFKDLEQHRAAAGDIFADLMRLGEQGIPDFLQPHINQLIELGLLTEDQAAQLRALADAGATNWDKVTAAAEQYGVRIESLGTPFQAQRIGADAAGLINAFETIVTAGGDVGGVLFDMQDEIGALVAEAKKFNIPLPENLKPMILELQRAGLLTEDLTDLQFGEAIETEAEKTRKAFEGITEAIRELIRTINGIPSFGGGGVPSTAPGAPTGVEPAGVGAGVVASVMAGGGGARSTFHVPIAIDGRVVADVVIDQMGNRLAVRGAR